MLDGLKRAHQPIWVVGVLALVVAVLFGGTVGAQAPDSVAVHRLMAAEHHGLSTDGAGQHPLVLHTEGDQVETPDAAGHDFVQFTTAAVTFLRPSALLDSSSGARPAPPSTRALLQVWRT